MFALATALEFSLGDYFMLAGWAIAILAIAAKLWGIWKKVKAGKVDEAKAAGYQVSDKIIDLLVEVVEKYELSDAKKKIAEEAEKDPEVKAALNVKLENKGYLAKSRKENRGN